MQRLLSARGFASLWCGPGMAHALLGAWGPEAVLLRLCPSTRTLLRLCQEISVRRGSPPIVALLRSAALSDIVAAFHAGARNLLLDPCEESSLLTAVRQSLGERNDAPGEDPARLPSLAEVDRGHVLAVLQVVRGNRTWAAQILGIDRKTLYRWLRGRGP